MQKTTRGHSHTNSHIHLSDDVKKIKESINKAIMDGQLKTKQFVAYRLEDFKEKSADMTEKASEYIAKKPFKSLGMAAGVGFLMGLLIRSRR